MNCANVNSEEFKELSSTYGEDFAYAMYENIDDLQNQYKINGSGYAKTDLGVNLIGFGLLKFPDGVLELDGKKYTKKDFNDNDEKTVREFLNRELLNGENALRKKYNLRKQDLFTKKILVNDIIQFDKVKESVQDKQLQDLQNLIEELPEDFEFAKVSLQDQLLYRLPKRGLDGEFTTFFNPLMEQEIVDTIFTQIMTIVELNSDVDKRQDITRLDTAKESFGSILNRSLNTFKRLGYKPETLSDKARANIKNLEVASENARFIVNSWGDILPRVKQKFAAENVSIKDNETDEEQVTEKTEKSLAEDYDKQSIEVDPATTIAQRLKLFLSFIPEVYYDSDLKEVVSKRNSFGLPKIYGFKKLYTELLSQFANQPELTFDDIINVLELNKESKPIFYEVAQKFKNASGQLQKELVRDVRKNNLRSYLVTLKKINNVYDFQIFEAGKDAVLKHVKNEWKENQKTGTELFKANENNEIGIDASRVEFYKSWFEKLKVLQLTKQTSELAQNQKQLSRSLLKDLGISLVEEAWAELYSGARQTKKNTYRRPFATQFNYTGTGAADGLFTALFDDILGKSEATKNNTEEEIDYDIIKNNPLYTSNDSIEFLATLQSRHLQNITSASHVTPDGRQIYDYSKLTFESNEINKLLNNDEYLLERQKDIFAGNAPFFAEIFLKSTNKNDYRFGVLEGLKNLYGRQNKFKNRSNFSLREQLITSLSLFVNKGNPKALLLELTKSDKTNSPLHVNVPKIQVRRNNYEGAKSYFRKVIDAEIKRIKLVQENKDTITNSALKKGGELFYFVHLLNEKYQNELLYGKDGKLVGNLTEDDLIWKAGVFNLKTTSKSPAVEFLLDDFIEKLYSDTEKEFKQLKINDKVILNNFKSEIDSLFKDTQKLEKELQGEKTIELKEKQDRLKYLQSKEIVEDTKMQFAVNSYLFNVSISMMFSGDPALFFKGKTMKDSSGNEVLDINKTLIATYNEYGKRQAKDNAPGSLSEHEFPTYRSLIIEVPNTSVKYLENYNKLISYQYLKDDKIKKGVDTTDAVQYGTMKRMVQLAKDSGEIPLDIYDSLNKKITDSITDETHQWNFDEKESEYLFSVLKPREVSLRKEIVLADGSTYTTIDYIKCALFPLLPNLSEGLEIDKLRKMMEKKGIDQAYMTSAGKSGNVDKPLRLFEDDVYQELGDEKINSSIRTMQSEGFLIQQDIPFDEEKAKITFGTQFNKLVTDTIAAINEPIFNGKTGLEISIEKEEIRKRMIAYEKANLSKKLGITENGVDVNKLAELLIDNTSNLTIQEKTSLATYIDENKNVQFVTPLFYNSFSKRFQSSLMSLVRKVVQPKMPGKSFVQASALGLKRLDKSGVLPSGIVATDGFNGELKTVRVVVKELNVNGQEIYLTQEQLDLSKKGKSFKLTNEQKKGLDDEIKDNDFTGTMLPAQVLVPFDFFGKGELKIEDYMIDGKIDNSKLPKELLTLLGFRIPNQSHSSQLPIEIVGFLNANIGDIIYVPNGITKQMGSDFDVDKLFVYRKNFLQDEDKLIEYSSKRKNALQIYRNELQNLIDEQTDLEEGLERLNESDVLYKEQQKRLTENIKRLDNFVQFKDEFLNRQDEVTDSIEDLQDAYFDNLFTILNNVSMFEKVLAPLDLQDLNDIVGEKVSDEEYETYHSLVKQLRDYNSNSGAKSEVGTSSLHFTNESLTQRTKNLDLAIQKTIKGEAVEKDFTLFVGDIGLNTFSGMGFSKYKNEERTTSDVIKMLQSAAVDHAKDKVIDKININEFTDKALYAFVRLKEKNNKDLFKQRAVGLQSVVDLLYSDIIQDYAKIVAENKDEFADSRERREGFKGVIKKLNAIVDAEENKKYQISDFDVDNLFAAGSFNILENEIDKDKEQTLKLFLILDKIGEELFTSIVATNSDTKGAGTSIGESLTKKERIDELKETYTYIKNKNELLVSPYSNESTEISDTIDATIGFTDEFLEPLFGYKKLQDVYYRLKQIKGGFLTTKERKTVEDDYRKFIFSSSELGIWQNPQQQRNRLLLGEDSLAHRLTELKLKYGRQYHLFNKLQTDIHKKKDEASYVTYDTNEKELDKNIIYAEFFDLQDSQNEDIKDFIKDLIIYNYVVLGNQNSPNSFTQLIPPPLLNHNKYLRNIENNRFNKTEEFVRQFVQHRPSFAQAVDIKQYKKEIVLSIENSQVSGQPQFIFVQRFEQDKQKQYVYELWNNQDDKLNYFLISKLGSNNTNEYNYTDTYITSSLPENFIPQTLNRSNFEKILLETPFKGDDEVTGAFLIDTTLNKTLLRVVKDLEKDFNVDGANQDTLELAKLYKEILSNDRIPTELKDSFSSYFSGNHSISLRPTSTKIGTIENILHETSHALTVRVVEKSMTNPELFTDEVNEAVQNLVDLKDYVIRKLIDEAPAKKKAVYTYVQEQLTYAKTLGENERVGVYKSLIQQYPNEIRLVYGTLNVKEFITHVLTNRDFQGQIANLRDNNAKISVLDRLKDWFSDFIKKLGDSIGIKLRNDSVLVSATNNAFKIIEKYPDLKPLLDSLYSSKQEGEGDYNIDNNSYKIPVWYDNIVTQLQSIYNSEPLTLMDEVENTRKRGRLELLLKQIDDLKVAKESLNRDADAQNQLAEMANIQANWIRNFLNQPKKVEDVAFFQKIINTWKNIDQVLGTENDGTPFSKVIQDVIGLYSSIEKEFTPIAYEVARNSASKRNIPFENAFSEMKDNGYNTFQLMELDRTSNAPLMLTATIINEASIKIETANRNFSDRVRLLGEKIKKNNIDTNALISNRDGNLHSLIDGNFYSEWKEISGELYDSFKTKKAFDKKKYVEFVRKNIVTLDLEKTFDILNGKALIKLDDIEIEQLAKELYKDNLDIKEASVKYIENHLEEQRRKIQSYIVTLEIREEQIQEIRDNTSIDEQERLESVTREEKSLDKWKKWNNPFNYKKNLDKGEYSGRGYLSLIPKVINAEYAELVKNPIQAEILLEYNDIMKSFLDVLPRQRRKGLSGNFVPIVANKLVAQTGGLPELLNTLKNPETYTGLLGRIKDSFSDKDFFKDNTSLEDNLRFLDDEQGLREKKEDSKNILANLLLFGQMVNHYSYFNEVLPEVLLMKDLIANANVKERKTTGEILPQGKLLKGSEVLPLAMEQLMTNISQRIYLNRTKPDMVLPFTRTKPKFQEIRKKIALEKLKADESLLAKLEEEERIINEAEEAFNRNLVEKAKNIFKQQDLETTEILYNWYHEQIDALQQDYNNDIITSKTELFDAKQRWYNRLSLLNREVYYGSKITDKMTEFKRLLTLGFSPFSGFTNLVSGTVTGYIYASGGVDFDVKNYNKALGMMLTSWKGIGDASDKRARKLHKIAQVLQIDKNLVDHQGVKVSSGKFTEAAYAMMAKSENFGKMALVTAYLLHNKVGDKSMWDSFDNDGNWIGEGNMSDEFGVERVALVNKMRRITGAVMGTTGLKMLNQTGFGRLLGTFRASWLPEVFASRFEEESFDTALGRVVKGRYVTYGELGLANSALGVLKVWQSILTKNDTYSKMKKLNGKTLDPIDIENLKRNATEALFIASTMMLIAVLKFTADKDDDRKALYYALINQFLLLERDLTSVTFGTLADLIGGNLIPTYKLVRDFGNFTSKATDFIFTDEVEQKEMFKAMSKIVPGMNLYNKFKWQTESLLDK